MIIVDTLANTQLNNGDAIYFGNDIITPGAYAKIVRNISVARLDIVLPSEGLNFTGTITGNVIDFSNVVIVPTGSNGPCLIRAGTYDIPLTNTDENQSGFIRLYGTTDADGSSYDRGIFVCLKTTGLKGIFPIAGLAEIKAQTGIGPKKAQAAQFTVALQDATSILATMNGDATAGMYAAWLKVSSHGSSEASLGSRVAAIWLDNQMIGTVSGEEYAAFITTGGTVPDAVFGFETTGAGWAQFLYFDETCYATTPVATNSLKVLLDTTQWYLPLSSTAGGYTSAYAMNLTYTTGPALTVTQATVDNDARGVRFLFTQATPAMTDGYGIFETELSVSGTATGAIAVASTWLNLGGAAQTAVGNYVFVHSDGIYDSGATIQGNIAWAKYQCLLASNPAWCSIWELNFSGVNSEIDAIFNVNSLILALGYQAGTPTKVAVGSIPFCSEAGGQLRYIYLYDEADAD